MTILYSLVARGTVVLAEFSATQTNAGAIARQILEKIPGTNDSHVSYSQDRYVFHVTRTDGITVLCVADDTAGRRIPFAFLEEIHGRFVKTYGHACHTALAYAMNEEFSRVLSQQMEYYSNDPNADRINRIRGEMSQVRNVMIENIDKVLERGDRLEVLVDKTEHMQGNTTRFRKQARRFRSSVWCRNVKLILSHDESAQLTEFHMIFNINKECILFSSHINGSSSSLRGVKGNPLGHINTPPSGHNLCCACLCVPWCHTSILYQVVHFYPLF
ncbi:vesicle-associated membrane protein 711-like isoform X1 [Typha angustifolia]|uniref:vesicle-associated membrane protein 711-like isoform X1 n=1 Tax=Typha angustifolia TaxID=59011 RepID=UPI003C2DD1A1